MKRIAVFSFSAIALVACYPTAESTDRFPVAAVAQVRNEAAFRDCMMDGLNPMEGWLLNRRNVQQEVRSDGTRIDTSVASGNIQLSRTEMFSDGKVQIRVADYPSVAMIDRSPEVAVFHQCVARFR